jgi:hypothetical protein
MNPLVCYGDDIAAVADLVPDFDARSLVDTRAWLTREWEAIGEVLGFAQELTRASSAVPFASDRLTALNLATLEKLTLALRHRRPGVSAEHARVQRSVLQQLDAIGRERGELWRVSIDPTLLPTGACYLEGGRSLRAFYPDTAPGWFGDGWSGPPPRAESACGWRTPLVLHLGTFPWVYSSRLDAVAPGMRWTSSDSLPVVEGLYIMASMLGPAGNLQQDARQVAAIYRHFAAHTAPVVGTLPTAGALRPGQLHRRRDGYLEVHQGSLHVASLDGPRGLLAATAYNYVLRRFACFFAVRRAVLRALPSLSAELQQIAGTSADPCLRGDKPGVAATGRSG